MKKIPKTCILIYRSPFWIHTKLGNKIAKQTKMIFRFMALIE